MLENEENAFLLDTPELGNKQRSIDLPETLQLIVINPKVKWPN